MKKYTLSLLLFLTIYTLKAQDQTINGTTFKTNGYVGIGTTNPLNKLHINSPSARLGGNFTSATFSIIAEDESAAPARTAALSLHGYEGRAKGIYISDKNYPHKWFIGELYSAHGFGIGYSTDIKQEYPENSKFFVSTSGKVGIGTTSPSHKLSVGTSNPALGGWASIIAQNGIIASSEGNSTATYLYNQNESGVHGINAYNYTSNSYIPLYLGWGGNDVYIAKDNGGNVGIGTTSPDAKLTVKGHIHTQEVKVDLNGAVTPDYVFEEDYPLPSLEETEAFIQANKHLPEVPSAAEMEANGIELKEMNLLLLKKIEELTLHQIDLLKKLELQDQDINALKVQNDSLNQKLEVLVHKLTN